jgi:hypothetical protein
MAVHSIFFGVKTCPLQNVGVHVVNVWSVFSLTLLFKQAMVIFAIRPWIACKTGCGNGLLKTQNLTMAFLKSRLWPWLACEACHGHGLLVKLAMAMACLQSKPWLCHSLQARYFSTRRLYGETGRWEAVGAYDDVIWA